MKIDEIKQTISSIVVASPEYIVAKFGSFGVPTIKYQMIISNLARKDIINDTNSCFFRTDTYVMSRITSSEFIPPKANIASAPTPGYILSLKCIKERITRELIGLKLEAADTKTRGQALE
ncbi:MAG: nuclease, partial [Clostridia bacterium]|nr:nuclease [Clostridia bacterium]